MAAPIPPMLKYSIVHNFLNSPPIFIKFVSKFMFCKALYFETQYASRLRSPLIVLFNFTEDHMLDKWVYLEVLVIYNPLKIKILLSNLLL